MKIGMLGAGAWGITLSALLSEKGNDVTVWEFDKKRADELVKERKLSFFPEAVLPQKVKVTNSFEECVIGKDFIVLAVPSHVLRKVVLKIKTLGADISNTIFVSATKGLEESTLMRMSEIILVELDAKDRVVVLSGPTIAKEVAEKIATAVTAASSSQAAAKKVQDLFSTSYFRVYTNSDVTGVETGGALKNVFAIASGICDGLGLGDNTKAALITRGLREFIMLGTNMGGQPSTFFGLTGMGDLIVTSYSKHSRNRTLGEKIGKGIPLTQAEKEIIMVAEGVKTAKSAYKLGNTYKLELPIIEQVYQVLYYQKSARQAVEELMTRNTKSEAVFEIGKLVI